MAWTEPQTAVSGAVHTAATHNTQVVENLKFLIRPPLAKARRFVSGVSIPNTADTTVVWNSTTKDSTGTMHPAGTPERLVAPVAGTYRASYELGWTANPTGIRRARLYVNGAGLIESQATLFTVTGANDAHIGRSVELVLAPNDYITVTAYHSAGAALNVTPLSWMSLHLISL